MKKQRDGGVQGVGVETRREGRGDDPGGSACEILGTLCPRDADSDLSCAFTSRRPFSLHSHRSGKWKRGTGAGADLGATHPTVAATAPAAGMARLIAPRNPAELAAFLREQLAITVPMAMDGLGEGDSVLRAASPLEYLSHTFFEGLRFDRAEVDTGERGPPDSVVWANRGGGKTFLGAVATMLDLVFKPGIQVRILGGSLEQSKRMQEHLSRLFEHPALARLVKPGREGRGARSITLINTSRAEVLAASETSVRGVRVQKVRCDEVELFDPALWRAVQLTTRAMHVEGPWGPVVRGSIEALSTMHLPYGIMWDLVGAGVGGSAHLPAASPARRLFRWGLVDALEHCTEEHTCDTCNLFEDCRGRAKTTDPARGGHIRIADAQAQKRRVDVETWRSEMLCLEPRTHDLVYPEFAPATHVVGLAGDEPGPRSGNGTDKEWIGGMDFGFRAETAILLGRIGEDNVLTIEHELIATQRVLRRHIEALQGLMRSRGGLSALRWLAADPAGNAKNDQSGEANIALLREAGIAARSRKMEIAEGLKLVRARLAPASGPPRLFVHARCTRLIESLRRYHFKPGDGRSQVPAKGEFDHACDALRYMVAMLDASREVKVGVW